MKKFVRGILAAALAATMVANTAFSAGSEAGDGLPSQNASDVFELPKLERNIYLQDDMRAVFINYGEDFSAESDNFSELCENIMVYGMNAVVINYSPAEGENFDLDLSSQNCINHALDTAHEMNLCAYVTLDVNALINGVIESGGGLKEGFSAAAHKFVMKYGCEGIILTNYYTENNKNMYAEYLRSGSGIGYENWLYEINRYVFRTVSGAVRGTSSTTAVGFLVEDMWANASRNEDGSNTADTFQALYDGYCDTKKYVEQGYADFVLVKAYGSTENTTLNFNNVVSWWYELGQKNGVKTYVCHLNERVGNREGWNVDQLVRQLTVMEDMDKLGGSAFHSYSSLINDPLGSSTKLREYYDGKINSATIFEDLTMISPTQLNYTTYDTNVKFAGTFDENFDVYFNGSKITLNEMGNFYIQKELSVGMNTFTIEHKGKKYTYSIYRSVDVLKSIDNVESITVEGGTRITLSAVAYTGGKVSASINGKIINLQEKASSEKLDSNGSYSEFVGYYTTPDGIIGTEQPLGNITFYSVYQGIEEYMTGGAVTVAAKPQPPAIDIEVDIKDQSTAGTGEVVGTMDPVCTEDETVKYIKVLSNYTSVFDPLMTGDVPSPLFTELPAGTLDYYKSTVGNYLVSTSGKRYRQSEVTTFTDTGLGTNALVVKSVGNANGKSFIKMHFDYKVSYTVKTDVEFSQGTDGPFAVKNFNPQYVYITFDNITSVTKIPDMSSCALFSAGEWRSVEENGVPKFQLVLTLRQAGIYSGAGASYDENGDLVISFNVPTPSLAGKVIVIDPGHGLNSSGKMDPGTIGEVTEQVIALGVAKKLEAQLTEMGATVYRLHTEETYYATKERPSYGRKYDADMFVSLHCNGVDYPDAHGVEVYYYTPYSQPLAAAINNNLAAFYNDLYADGTNSSRGDKYSYYWMTLEESFPSVMVEMGFVSNPRECLAMANSDNQEEMAEAIADGIYSYFARSNLSY